MVLLLTLFFYMLALKMYINGSHKNNFYKGHNFHQKIFTIAMHLYIYCKYAYKHNASTALNAPSQKTHRKENNTAACCQTHMKKTITRNSRLNEYNLYIIHIVYIVKRKIMKKLHIKKCKIIDRSLYLIHLNYNN